MMGHILHDWNLEEKKMLVSKLMKLFQKVGPSSPTTPSSTTIARRMPLAFS
jgi:hypothetical protein